MYSVTVRDHCMIAHSFEGEVFGPAQSLHGATYVVDVTLYREALDDDGVAAGIDQLRQLLARQMAEFNLRNLDDDPNLVGANTTTEFLAGVIFERLQNAIVTGEAGDSARQCRHMKVTLGESHVAWASYEAGL